MLTKIFRISAYAISLGLFLRFVMLTQTNSPGAGWVLVSAWLALSFALATHPVSRAFSFAVVLFAALSAALYYPRYFLFVGDHASTEMVIPLLQVIMFGMGAQIGWDEITQIVRTPYPILVGLVCQFTIMPIVGAVLAYTLPLPIDVAVGLILVGCAPSGVASSVMVYLAGANLALSVAITVSATLLAPLLTPALMKLLAGRIVTIDVMAMMWDITKMVALPVIGGLLVNRLLFRRLRMFLRALPLLSMTCIAMLTVIITATAHRNLTTVGGTLIAATLVHNLLGYLFGYCGARLMRLPQRDCRTVAIEVGLQNSGLALGIATKLGQVATLGLAAVVFGPLMSITGSALAMWWRRRTPQ